MTCDAVMPGNWQATIYVPVCQLERGHEGNHVGQDQPEHYSHGYGWIRLRGLTWRKA